MMVAKTQSVHSDLFVRRCVFCGYDGALLCGGLADTCADCGCDLRKRPARSYAEMEGLAPPPAKPNSLLFDEGHALSRSGHAGRRWLSFLFMVVVGLLLKIYLVAAALP